jgi:hypothetical protein
LIPSTYIHHIKKTVEKEREKEKYDKAKCPLNNSFETSTAITKSAKSLALQDLQHTQPHTHTHTHTQTHTPVSKPLSLPLLHTHTHNLVTHTI